MTRLIFLLYTFFVISCTTQQKADNDFDVSVAKPAFLNNHPVILFDEAHNNMHTIRGTYSPFVNLISNDGCIVKPNSNPFTNRSFINVNILVISNAKGGLHDNKEKPAFSNAECIIIKDWVAHGGSLLLVADHYPFGSAAENLAEQFGVHMFNGETADSLYFEGDSSYKDKLVFSKQNGLLFEHAITQDLNKVVSDRGQSLSIPPYAVPLLKLSVHSYQTLPDSIWKDGDNTKVEFSDPVSSKNNCQGLAMNYDKGRVVMLGEAAMITAQKYDGEKFGMNRPGNDNKQFALNIIRWLGRAK